MKHYFNCQELSQLIRDAQAGSFPTKLYQLILEITRRWKGDEDVAHDVVLAFLQWLPKIDPEANPYSYIVQMVKSRIWELQRKNETRWRWQRYSCPTWARERRIGRRRPHAY